VHGGGELTGGVSLSSDQTVVLQQNVACRLVARLRDHSGGTTRFGNLSGQLVILTAAIGIWSGSRSPA
jgi:hypothetical protein